ncbi:MAG TPA: GspH/FimT family pseudopilin [Rubrivivax sp.]|nr:GspH/FimT family pseudopilin [Rubrivivax sp.]
MLIATRPRRGGRATSSGFAHGFTLVELLVTAAVLAVGLSLAAPAFTQQIANYRVRGAAESIVNGLNYARAEAVRRNGPVSFTLDSSGPGWTVEQVSTAAALQSRASGETPGVSATSSNGALALTFTPTGLVDTSGTRLVQVTLGSSVAHTDSRQIDIFGGGLIRVCDPTVATADDPRGC